jgi:hypothetical protein
MNQNKKAFQMQETFFKWFQRADAAKALLLHQPFAASNCSQKAKHEFRLYSTASRAAKKQRKYSIL